MKKAPLWGFVVLALRSVNAVVAMKTYRPGAAAVDWVDRLESHFERVDFAINDLRRVFVDGEHCFI